MESYCVLISAAGRCRRMGAFKPLLPIGDTPAILHMLENYFRSGVSHAVIVTGYQAETLKAACSGYPNITFVHNPDYLTNEMYDSILLGLSAVPETYSHILFTPVDIPFVSPASIRAVIETEGDLVFPSYQLRKGHPLKISSKHFSSLLSHNGEDGLRGALSSLKLSPVYAIVNDPFILTDMDTPEAYQKLLRQYQEDLSCQYD